MTLSLIMWNSKQSSSLYLSPPKEKILEKQHIFHSVVDSATCYSIHSFVTYLSNECFAVDMVADYQTSLPPVNEVFSQS